MRLDTDTYREIADSLTRNKSRSLLTAFGVFWGLFMLLFMLGGGHGLKAMLTKTFEGFASNTVIIVADQTTKPYKGLKEGRSWSFRLSDVDRLKNMIPELAVVSPMISNMGQTAVCGAYTVSANVKGIYPDYGKIEAPSLKYGRYINESDSKQSRKVCVIGKKIYNTLFPEGGDPCGTFIKVGSVYYQVVGVDWSESNISINGSSQESVTIPFPVAQTIYHRGNTADIICMTGRSGVKMTSLEPKMRSVMGREHGFDPSDKPAMFILNTEQIFNLMDNLFRGVDFLIWLIGLGTILAGAIGVSNIMMVTVKERTVEIGIRRAIGATPRDILSQIMLESVSLTMLAGCSAIVFSVLVLRLVEAISHHPVFQISFWTALAAVILITLLGVLAGLAPASRAMKIKPVDAMRDE